uniref:Vitelline membrane outer layer protein 1 homolog n=1 Tax=Eptatretus burgeri TaxID=7764 RepID=A0A8C4QTR9_EPTBU
MSDSGEYVQFFKLIVAFGVVEVLDGGGSDFRFIWGSWTQPQWCPRGHLSAFRLRVQAPQGAFRDDTAANNIDFKCSDNSTLVGRGTTDGEYGSWSEDCGPQWCPYGHLSAFRLRVQSPQGAFRDDTAANNIDFKCSHGATLEGRGTTSGTYGSWSEDCGKKAICGLRTKIEKWLGIRDDTALNDVQFYCCE